MELSVVLPVYNEEDNLQQLHSELDEVMEENFDSWEIIFVDDGSEDSSFEVMRKLADSDPDVKIIKLRKNFGQTPAIQEGLRSAEGDTIVTMDSDLQNDPKDIPRLVEELEKGYGCVVGWRRDREDPLPKKVTSQVAARMRSFFLGTELHDYGCTLKAFTSEAAEDLSINGEMHRYIPPILERRGYTVTEVEVNHRERRHGETKYSWRRIPKGFVDMLNIWFWQNYRTRPMHVFGGLSALTFLLAVTVASATLSQIINGQLNLYRSYMPLLIVLLFYMSVKFFVSGLKIDLQFRNFYQASEKKKYEVETTISDQE